MRGAIKGGTLPNMKGIIDRGLSICVMINSHLNDYRLRGDSFIESLPGSVLIMIGRLEMQNQDQTAYTNNKILSLQYLLHLQNNLYLIETPAIYKPGHNNIITNLLHNARLNSKLVIWA